MDSAALQRLIDESDLRKLIEQMPWRLDNRDWEGVAQLFTEDGMIEIRGDERRGREAIAAGPKRDLERLYEATFHHMGNIYVDVDGDEATVVAYVVAYHLPKASDPTTSADAGGKYHAEAVRTKDGWRFRQIRLELIWMGGIPFQL